MQVKVDKDLDSALKLLKKKLVKEGVFKEIKARKHYEKPSVKKKRKSNEARRQKN
jgi:small subunit ribosomal protein S21